MTKAFLFDLNGTMINDMDYHIDAWFDVFNKYGAKLNREQVRLETYGKGEEMLVRAFGPDKFTNTEMGDIVLEKEKHYQKVFKPHLKLIDGLEAFLAKAHQRGIKMGIGSAAIMFNIDYVLDGLNIRSYFSATVSADNVEKSKPNPETFLSAASQLGVEPKDCIVFEDSPKGVQAALNAGMQAVVITIMHEKQEFEGLDNILFFITDYNDPQLAELLHQ